MFTWYCVHEKTNYQDIAPGVREDIGEYVVSECNADSVKSTLKSGSNYNEDYINEFVFENKQDALKLALSLTIVKLQKVIDKMRRYEAD